MERQIKVTGLGMETVPDEYPDLSWLGEFSDTPEEGAINHKERSGERRVYTYFNPANPEYAEEDYKRMMAYNRDEWHMLGVRAVCQIKIPVGDTWVLQTIKSPGLWGVESDASQKYIDQVYQEEKATLKQMLEAMGATLEKDE